MEAAGQAVKEKGREGEEDWWLRFGFLFPFFG